MSNQRLKLSPILGGSPLFFFVGGVILIIRTGAVVLAGLAMRSRAIFPAVIVEYRGAVGVQLGRCGVPFRCALVCLFGVLVGLLGVRLRLGHLLTGRTPSTGPTAARDARATARSAR